MPWPTMQASRVTIHPMSPESTGVEHAGVAIKLASTTSVAYVAANRAIYVPFYIGDPLVAVQMFTSNGATASGNIDVGIYSADGCRLVSMGSTAQAGTSVLQAFDIANTQLGRGNYYIAVAKDDAVGTLMRFSSPTVRVANGFGVFEQATAFPLPATATFSRMSTIYIPAFGLSTRAVL